MFCPLYHGHSNLEELQMLVIMRDLTFPKGTCSLSCVCVTNIFEAILKFTFKYCTLQTVLCKANLYLYKYFPRFVSFLIIISIALPTYLNLQIISYEINWMGQLKKYEF